MTTRQEQNVMATADDAILAKLATVKAGYYEDPYLEAFGRHAAGLGGGRQRVVQPIIKRGTHARVACMDRVIRAFLDHDARHKQVVVLGCGKDTSFFRHCCNRSKTTTTATTTTTTIAWIEVDHAAVLHTKATILEESPTVFHQSKIQKSTHGYTVSTTLHNQHQTCHLLAHDLIDDNQLLLEKLNSIESLDAQAPTLFLLECVLMYLPDPASRNLLSTLAKAFPHAVVACYEPILGQDAFGTVMEQNLIQAGVAPGGSCLRTTRTLSAHLEKLIHSGWTMAVGCHMADAYDTILTQDQRKRANQSEFLDELEEWLLIMRHYCFVVATNGSEEETVFCQVGKESTLGFLTNKCQKMTNKES